MLTRAVDCWNWNVRIFLKFLAILISPESISRRARSASVIRSISLVIGFRSKETMDWEESGTEFIRDVGRRE